MADTQNDIFARNWTNHDIEQCQEIFSDDSAPFRAVLNSSLDKKQHDSIEHFQYVTTDNYLYIATAVTGKNKVDYKLPLNQSAVNFVLSLPNLRYLIELELKVTGDDVNRFKDLYLGNKLLFEKFLSNKKAVLSCHIPIQGHRKTQKILDQLDLYFAQSDPESEFMITIDAVNTDDDKLTEAYLFFCIILLALSKRMASQGLMLFWRNAIAILKT